MFGSIRRFSGRILGWTKQSELFQHKMRNRIQGMRGAKPGKSLPVWKTRCCVARPRATSSAGICLDIEIEIRTTLVTAVKPTGSKTFDTFPGCVPKSSPSLWVLSLAHRPNHWQLQIHSSPPHVVGQKHFDCYKPPCFPKKILENILLCRSSHPGNSTHGCRIVYL